MQEINDEEQQTVESLISPKAMARHQWYREHKKFAMTILIINTAIVMLGGGGTAAMFAIGLNNQSATKYNYDQVDKIEALQNTSDGVVPLIDKYASDTTIGADQIVFRDIKNYLIDFVILLMMIQLSQSLILIKQWVIIFHDQRLNSLITFLPWKVLGKQYIINKSLQLMLKY